MPVGFTTWTVCKHNPIEKLGPDLWRVSGGMPSGPVQRSMAVARRADGDLVIYNAISLDEPEMAELTAFGRVAYLVIPNGFHRQDAFTWKQRFPDAKIVAPRGGAKAAAKAAPVDLICDALPADPQVWLGHTDGMGEKEALMIVRGADGASVIACDSVCNLPEAVGFPMSYIMGPTGRLSAPRIIRWVMMKDGAALAARMEQLNGELARIIPGHGAILEGETARESVRGLIQQLRG